MWALLLGSRAWVCSCDLFSMYHAYEKHIDLQRIRDRLQISLSVLLKRRKGNIPVIRRNYSIALLKKIRKKEETVSC